MAVKWYFAREGKKFGPFSAVQLKELAATEKLRPQDTVWKEGMQQGVLATKVKELFSPIPARAAPAPPAMQTVPAPSPSPAPPPESAADSVPPSNPLEAETTAPEPRTIVPEGLELASMEDDPSAVAVASESTYRPEPERPMVPPQEPVKKRRVLGVKGGVISSQDGEVVKYRKQCLKCRYADVALTTMRIRSGITRVNFFCPKCKKSQQCEIQGVG
jgi:hypothetical protein